MPRRFPLPAALFASFTFLTVASGQGVRLGTDGKNDLQNEWKQNKELAKELIAGRVVADPMGDPKHKEALDSQAKWVTWQYFWLQDPAPPKAALRIYQEFDSDVSALKRGLPTTRKAAEIYSERVGERAVDVLKHPSSRLIAKVNAARLMARAAELGQPSLTDPLLAALKLQGLSEGVRLYALRGLRELLAQDPPVLGKERLPAVVAALTEALDRKPDFDPMTTPPEDVDGFRYVRREAVRALAQIKDPSAAGPGKPALALLRVVSAEGLSPEPRVDERLDAAIGLAHMRPADRGDKNYQPGFAVYKIGQMLDAFSAAVRQDRKVIADSAGRKDEPRPPNRLPWRIYAARLSDALRVLQDESAGDQYLAKVIPECRKLLRAIEEEAADIGSESLQQFLEMNPPPSDRLIKGLDSSTLKTK